METNEETESMNDVPTGSAANDVETIRQEFHNLLMRANKERPKPTDLQALTNLLNDNKEMELWKAVIGMGELAESQALDTIVNGSG
jgi:hypothetical protein